jgi:hypothetical protein
MNLSPKAEAALAACFATRGPSKGHLKAKCPPSHTLEAAAWQGAMLVCNPYKASVASMLFMTAEQREVRDEVLAYMEAQPLWKQRKLDRDRQALSKLGVW